MGGRAIEATYDYGKAVVDDWTLVCRFNYGGNVATYTYAVE